MKVKPILICSCVSVFFSILLHAQPLMETGGQKMPDEWIDKDTKHKVIKLTRRTGNNMSFYFHNNPFIGNKMIFYSTDASGKHLYTVNLKTLALRQVGKNGANG